LSLFTPPSFVVLAIPTRRQPGRKGPGYQNRAFSPQPDQSNALNHIVVIMFENRSLDNPLGRLYKPDALDYLALSSALVTPA
jgi:phospholipase C